MRHALVSTLIAVIVALPLGAQSAHADSCESGLVQGFHASLVACFAPPPSLDLDVMLPIQPTAGSARVAPAVPSSVAGTVVTPVGVENSGAGVSMRASLDTLRDYNGRIASDKANDVRYLAPPNLQLPRSPVVAKSPFNLWSKFEAQGTEWAGETGTRAGFGMDYKNDRAVSFGVAGEHGDTRSAATHGARTDGTQTYDKVDAHVAYQVVPLFSLTSRAQWQAGNADFAAAHGFPDKRSVSVAPKLSKMFTLGDGQSIETFASYTRELDIEKQMMDGISSTFSTAQSAGAGVTFQAPGSYTLKATTDVTGLGSAEPATHSSRLQLNFPIK